MNISKVVNEIFDDMDSVNGLDPEAIKAVQKLMFELDFDTEAEDLKPMILFKAGILKGMLHQLKRELPMNVDKFQQDLDTLKLLWPSTLEDVKNISTNVQSFQPLLSGQELASMVERMAVDMLLRAYHRDRNGGR